MEKTLRVLGGGDEDGHSHSHSHSHTSPSSTPSAESSSVSTTNNNTNNTLKSRKPQTSENPADANGAGEVGEEEHHDHAHANEKGPSKLSAYLNLFGDFVHNMYVLSTLLRYSTHYTNNSSFSPFFFGIAPTVSRPSVPFPLLYISNHPSFPLHL